MSQDYKTSSVKIVGGTVGQFPIRLEMVPKRLVVSVFKHELVGIGSHIPCWVFVTQGMHTFKQKEFVLVLRAGKDGNDKAFPKAPLQLMLFLYKAVSQKRTFNVGDIIRLGEKGMLGYWGMGFTFELIAGKELSLPKHYLTCILLGKEGLIAGQAFGLTRVLARMSYEANRFPIGAWNDLERNNIPLRATITNSKFKNVSTLALKYCSVNLLEGEKVVLVLSPVIHSTICNFVKSQGGAARLGLITQLLPYHEGSLVWLPEKDSIEMNVLPDAEGNLIAGSFLLITRSETIGTAMLEDGFELQVDAKTWPQLATALMRKQNIVIPANNGEMEFNLIWNLSANPETRSGLGVSSADSGQPNTPTVADSSWLGKIKRMFKRG